MIGKVIVGGNFYDCLSYVLEDKQELTEKDKLLKSILEQVQHKDRAEVLVYNKCSGDAKRLAAQFLEVKKLNKRVEKPVFHFIMRLAPGDDLSRKKLIEMGEACVKEFGVADHQYIMVLHKDSKEPHLHIVANRVGFDGKLAKDFQNFKKMDAFCRRIEKEFHLKEVLSAKRYLPEELRHLPRQNTRFEKLKKDIQQTLEKVTTYQQFEEKMKSLGYKILKGRGICFIDDKKVRIKGSEVGFPLTKIEKILHLRQQYVSKQAEEKIRQIAIERAIENRSLTPSQKFVLRTAQREHEGQSETAELGKTIEGLLYDLFKPEYTGQYINPELLKEANRKRKRKRHHL